jgi:hypothetical protein
MDSDLHGAQNYLNEMQRQLNETKHITLEKFGTTILRELQDATDTRLVDREVSRILSTVWRVRDDLPASGFQYMYDMFVRPNICIMAESLEGVKNIVPLDTDWSEQNMGHRITVFKSNVMAVRLTTHYDSDSGGGPNAATVMSIEVGIY